MKKIIIATAAMFLFNLSAKAALIVVYSGQSHKEQISSTQIKVTCTDVAKKCMTVNYTDKTVTIHAMTIPPGGTTPVTVEDENTVVEADYSTFNEYASGIWDPYVWDYIYYEAFVTNWHNPE